MASPEDSKSRRRPHTKSRLGCQECKQRKIKCNEDRPMCHNCAQRDRECNYTASEPERQPHTKSRAGCQQCKQRKIKCDEDHPICLNCIRRDIECSFAILTQRTADLNLAACSCGSPSCHSGDHSSEVQDLREIIASQDERIELMSQQLALLQAEVERIQAPNEQSTLDYAEVELLYHYFLMTTHNQPKEDVGHNFWCVRLLELGFSYPHVLHLILGYAALDKARCTPHQQADFFARADRYHTLGLQGATVFLGTINHQTYEVVYASALLISLHNIALGPRPGEYLGLTDHGRSSFMVFLRGLNAIREYKREFEDESASVYPELPARSCAMTILSSHSELPAQSGTPSALSKLSRPIDYRVQLQEFRNLVMDAFGSSDAELKTTCRVAVDQLEPFFEAAFGSNEHASKSMHPSDTYVQVPLGWLCRVPDTYLNYLEAKNPLALIIFAHFTIVLKELQSGWPVHGWPEHVMSGIWHFLPTERREHIQWPIEHLGLDLSFALP